MAAMTQSVVKGVLLPTSTVDPRFGRVKKAFIAYAHNPDPYEQYIPPYSWEELSRPDVFQAVLQQKAEHLARQKDKTEIHRRLIKRFANCLTKSGVAVSYDQCYEGQQISNTLNHFEQQICDSDAVLLIVTKSLKYYIDNNVPINEEEVLLTQHFLYNLITVKKPQGTCFIPVFLNQPINRSLIPTTLAGSTCYSIVEPFDCQSGDLYDLYAFLTNQRTLPLPQVTEVISLPPRKGPFGLSTKVRVSSARETELYTELSTIHVPLTQELVFKLPSEVAPHWRTLAVRLGLTPRDVQECIEKAGTNNDREACYQMLLHWQERYQQCATIAQLAMAFRDSDCGHLLYLLK